jgi:hypothetical protein
MLFGHFGVGLAVKRIAPEASTGVLLSAAAALDILFGVFYYARIETLGNPVPWSHGLFMSAIWAAATFAVAIAAGCRPRGGGAIAATVFSHWLLDFLSHPPGKDLHLLFSGSPLVGLGLYESPAVGATIEFSLFIGGIVLYLAGTRPVDRAGTFVFWTIPAYAAFLLAVNLALPPSWAGVGTIVQLGMLPLGMLVDRHRGIGRPAAAKALGMG